MVFVIQSAYFVISEDAKHGENLVCSYYACRNGGIKFRYCAYCMAPVAKRNFSRRHDHGMSKKKGANSIREEEEDDDDDDDDTLGESENIASDKGSMSSSVNPLNTSVKRPTEPSAPEIESKRPRLEADTTTTEEKESDIGEGVSSKRISMWNNLLNKRPRTKDPKGLSSWLNEVLAVSDLQFPLEEVGCDMDCPHGKLLLNKMPKLIKPAATPSEDEAIDSSGAIDTMDSSPTHSIADDQAKYSTNNESGSRSNSSDAATTDSADVVIGEENPLSASSDNQKESESASEDVKDETTESQKPDEKTVSSKADPENSVSSNGAKLLGKKSKLSPKKIITDGVEGKEKMKKKDNEGFAGSFADWRDRKKGKSLKKGPSSLRK